MGLKALEARILAELREVTGTRSIRQKDIMQWETSNGFKNLGQEGELTAYLPELRISVAYVKRAK
jgi:hypothetical protein